MLHFMVLSLIPSASRIPRYLYPVFKSISISISPSRKVIPSLVSYLPHFITNITHLCIPNSILISALNILTVFTVRSSSFSVLQYNFRSSMNRRWFTLPFSCHAHTLPLHFLNILTVVVNTLQIAVEKDYPLRR